MSALVCPRCDHEVRGPCERADCDLKARSPSPPTTRSALRPPVTNNVVVQPPYDLRTWLVGQVIVAMGIWTPMTRGNETEHEAAARYAIARADAVLRALKAPKP